MVQVRDREILSTWILRIICSSAFQRQILGGELCYCRDSLDECQLTNSRDTIVLLHWIRCSSNAFGRCFASIVEFSASVLRMMMAHPIVALIAEIGGDTTANGMGAMIEGCTFFSHQDADAISQIYTLSKVHHILRHGIGKDGRLPLDCWGTW